MTGEEKKNKKLVSKTEDGKYQFNFKKLVGACCGVIIIIFIIGFIFSGTDNDLKSDDSYIPTVVQSEADSIYNYMMSNYNVKLDENLTKDHTIQLSFHDINENQVIFSIRKGELYDKELYDTMDYWEQNINGFNGYYKKESLNKYSLEMFDYQPKDDVVVSVSIPSYSDYTLEEFVRSY